MENTKTTVTETKETATAAAANGAWDTLCVETKLGMLVVYPSKDPAHPGIYIDLKRDGYSVMAPVVLAEFTDDDGDASGQTLPASIMCRVWGNAAQEDYTDATYLKNLDQHFSES